MDLCIWLVMERWWCYKIMCIKLQKTQRCEPSVIVCRFWKGIKFELKIYQRDVDKRMCMCLCYRKCLCQDQKGCISAPAPATSGVTHTHTQTVEICCLSVVAHTSCLIHSLNSHNNMVFVAECGSTSLLLFSPMSIIFSFIKLWIKHKHLYKNTY